MSLINNSLLSAFGSKHLSMHAPVMVLQDNTITTYFFLAVTM